jgi:hypothetical protein
MGWVSSCGPANRIVLAYGRAAEHTSHGASISLSAGSSKFLLPRVARFARFNVIEADTIFESRAGFAPENFLAAAAMADSLTVSEVSGDSSRVTTLSTAGLKQALTTLRQKCAPTSST